MKRNVVPFNPVQFGDFMSNTCSRFTQSFSSFNVGQYYSGTCNIINVESIILHVGIEN